MKKLFLFIFIFCIILSGCSEEEKERFDAFFNSPVYNNYSGTYIMQEGEFEEEKIPTLQLDMSNLKFVYTYNSEYIAEGHVERHGGMLVLRTSDENHTYVFRIVDRYTLQFRKEDSSGLEDENSDMVIKDGTIFKLSEEERKIIEQNQKKKEEEEDNFIYWAY